jgi:hypothetical protein
MNAFTLSPEQITTLQSLASAIIPADSRGAGVAQFNPGAHLGGKLQGNPFASGLLQGLNFATKQSLEMFGLPVGELPSESLDKLLGILRDQSPGFFKFLRMETSALYLSQAATWQRIGFPGPSIEQGGYPDFDQIQGQAP